MVTKTPQAVGLMLNYPEQASLHSHDVPAHGLGGFEVQCLLDAQISHGVVVELFRLGGGNGGKQAQT